MKIIDLLNKIANGEEAPRKIKYKENIYEYYKTPTVTDYRCWDEETQIYGYLTSCVDYDTFNCLNDEVEIIEDNKKIEEIKWAEKESLAGSLNERQKVEILSKRTEKLKKSINEIIRKLKEVENER